MFTNLGWLGYIPIWTYLTYLRLLKIGAHSWLVVGMLYHWVSGISWISPRVKDIETENKVQHHWAALFSIPLGVAKPYRKTMLLVRWSEGSARPLPGFSSSHWIPRNWFIASIGMLHLLGWCCTATSIGMLITCQDLLKKSTSIHSKASLGLPNVSAKRLRNS